MARTCLQWGGLRGHRAIVAALPLWRCGNWVIAPAGRLLSHLCCSENREVTTCLAWSADLRTNQTLGFWLTCLMTPMKRSDTKPVGASRGLLGSISVASIPF